MYGLDKFKGALQDVLDKNMQETFIDYRPHFIPLNFNNLRAQLPHLTKEQLKVFEVKINRFIGYKFSKKWLTGKVVSNGIFVEGYGILSTTVRPKLPVVLYSGTTVAGILFPSKNSAYENFFHSFLNSTKLLKEFSANIYGKTDEGKNLDRGFDLGHTVIDDVAQSNLSKKLTTMEGLARMQASSASPKSAAKAGYDALATFYSNQHKELKAAQPKVKLSAKLTNSLATIGANVVLIQDRAHNQITLNKVENQLSAEIRRSIMELEIFHKKNIVQASLDKIVNALVDKKSAAGTNLFKDVVVEMAFGLKTKAARIPPKVPLPIGSPSILLQDGVLETPTNLKALLQARLHSALRLRMKKPALVYRTGRLAKSVEVVKLERSPRDRALTVYLRYMKYPYATFEPGGKQGSINRNPRTLIANAVRDIAVELMGERLKTVIV